MSSRMVSRGGKTRLFAFVCMVLVLSAVLYAFHGTQLELDYVRHSATSCTHQLESISSQLQVVVEHKLKLERSLEDEKREHVKTKEELNELLQDEKQLRDKQNVDSMNRYNEIERVHEALQEEEKKIRDELETLKLKYQEKEKINEKLVQNLDAAINELQSLRNEKVKLDGGKENIDNELNNNLQKSNELLDIKYNEKPSDNINASKLSSATPAINPQALYGATAKSSTPMIGSKLSSNNESAGSENDEANPINQPNMVIPSPVKESNGDLVSQNENETSPSQESKVGNESMKAMPAPPQEDNYLKEKSVKKVAENLNQKSKNLLKYEYEQEQERFKEEEDDEDINDFDSRDDNQHVM